MRWKKHILWKFDWYSAVIENISIDNVQSVLAGVNERTNYGVGRYKLIRSFEIENAGNKYYDKAIICRSRGGEEVARIYYIALQNKTKIECHGDFTPQIVPVIREKFPDHYATRFDVCGDWYGYPDLYDKIDTLMQRFAECHPKLGHKEYRDKRDNSRTRYLGSDSSVKITWYEKGKEQRTKEPLFAYRFPDDWFRLEVRVRPEGDLRYTAAKCPPEQAFGFARWSQDFLSEVFGVNVPRSRNPPRPPSSIEKKRANCANQYGAVLLGIFEEAGSPTAAVAEIERLVLAYGRPNAKKALIARQHAKEPPNKGGQNSHHTDAHAAHFHNNINGIKFHSENAS